MKHALKNERGTTLIEVIATIVVISVVTIVLSNILVDGFHTSNKQQVAMTMQQQANLLLVSLRELQENGEPYEIVVSDDKRQVTLTNHSTDTFDVMTSDRYFLELFINHSELPITYEKITPKTTKSIHIKIVITQQANEDVQYVLETTLSRL